MTRILVQRGSSGNSSSNPSRSALSGSSSTRVEPPATVPQAHSTVRDEDSGQEVPDILVDNELLDYSGSSDGKTKNDDHLVENLHYGQNDTPSDEIADVEKPVKEELAAAREYDHRLCGLKISERLASGSEGSSGGSLRSANSTPNPPPPPVPPPKPSPPNLSSKKNVSSNPNAVQIGPSRRASAWPVVSARTSPAGSRPTSPKSLNENEGYNSADEQNPCFPSSYDDLERERQFEIDIRRAKGYEVKRMMEDGNCLFRAVADQVYGDSESYDLVRQMCIDYMERERDHFSQFITEGFTSYCKRKRRDKVYGNNVEIQSLCEMYNRPIHIYSYTTEPINIFHGSYDTDTPPIRLSYHHGNHYNSLIDPRRMTVGAGLGFSCLRGTNVDKDQVKAAIKAQQDQQIDNALLAEGRFYSDLELTEKEIERMVIEASRAEYLADVTFKQQLAHSESSTSNAEPSSSGARSSGADGKTEIGKERDSNISNGIQMLLSMGFSYLQAIEAYSIFGDDVDSMVCYLLETSSSSRRKGKATE
ncbi:OVARIAN TUMOR DOMAIN-containing deubiquitinating enzyme 6-like isoform X2 [Prosopis cineraria]|uniref:OVARIAN TUMOR DOMAIN-containing deubiquitinating enzyme 6-like isoform X2 n=1 Tax=Prosopis cineraria TaxID=364024 RepID=UPI00240FC39A|nr:OVARIAN TUMOR DOMAIN-containing deubiquitinating enzyme 6-like isoform X2 [Prosopis cineraria]